MFQWPGDSPQRVPLGNDGWERLLVRGFLRLWCIVRFHGDVRVRVGRGRAAPDVTGTFIFAVRAPVEDAVLLPWLLKLAEYTTVARASTSMAHGGFHELVSVRVLNGIEEWGASDRCQLIVEFA